MRGQNHSEELQIVAIGGGHGLSTLLRGLKQHVAHQQGRPLGLTAIVTVADDGGSSGKLRREMGVPPPGDFRNCLIALADSESLMTRLFQYRFGEGTGLGGHSFGNLFIAAMGEITGSFERALAESSKVLAVSGRVLPSTLQDVVLVAQMRENEGGRVSRVVGESRIPEAEGAIERVKLDPEGVAAFPDAVRAILGADIVLAGPGSLYTSVLPNLLVSGITQAIRASSAAKMYVCNVATQVGETDHYSVADHVSALDRHVGPGLFPIVLANNYLDLAQELPDGVEMVGLDEAVEPETGIRADRPFRLQMSGLVDEACPWRHDPVRLSHAILDTYRAEIMG